ncbi:MAG: CHASE2 and HATPase_c domain-containing protein [Acidobacteriota bacterium]
MKSVRPAAASFTGWIGRHSSDLIVAPMLVLVLVVFHWAFLEEMDVLAFDFALRLRGTQKPDPRIEIVAIDDGSLASVGPWPWPPAKISRLLAVIDDANPAVVGVDLLLSRPTSEYPFLRQARKMVLGSALGFRPTPEGRALVWQEPILDAASRGVSFGHIHAGKDADGVCRSVPLQVSHGGRSRWAFSVELARVFLGVDPDQIRFDGPRLRIGDRLSIPRLSTSIDRAVDSLGVLPRISHDHLLINSRGPMGTFPYVPASRVLSEDPAALDQLRGKIVLLGATSYSLGDHLSTAFSGPSETPGIEIHANALDTILNRRFLGALTEPWTTVLLVSLSLGLWCLFAAWPRSRTLPAFILLVAGSVVFPLGAFLFADFWIPLVSTGFSVLLAGATSQFLHYSRLNRQLNRRYRDLSRLLVDSRAGADLAPADAAYRRHSLEWKLRLLGEASEAALQFSRERAEMTSFVSHELKTPLTSIQGFAELLEAPERLAPEDRLDAARLIREETARLAQMVTDYLQLSRLENQAVPLHRVEANLSGILARAGILVEKEYRNRSIRLVGLDRLPTVSASVDRDLLTQLFLNLLANAAKFSAAGTEVRVRLTRRDSVSIVEITDQGRGIPEDEIGRVFDKFYRGSADLDGTVPGSGLGLAFVKAVAQQHGGSVAVTSRPGVGSTFKVMLPCRPSETAEATS